MEIFSVLINSPLCVCGEGPEDVYYNFSVLNLADKDQILLIRMLKLNQMSG